MLCAMRIRKIKPFTVKEKKRDVQIIDAKQWLPECSWGGITFSMS